MPEPERVLGGITEARELLLHRPAYRDATWTETNWFGFFVPDPEARREDR